MLEWLFHRFFLLYSIEIIKIIIEYENKKELILGHMFIKQEVIVHFPLSDKLE